MEHLNTEYETLKKELQENETHSQVQIKLYILFFFLGFDFLIDTWSIVQTESVYSFSVSFPSHVFQVCSCLCCFQTKVNIVPTNGL